MNATQVQDSIVPLPNVLPVSPSQRMPLIEHALRQAQVMYVELRYEGRGGIGGYAVQFQDGHKQDVRWKFVEINAKQQLTGTLWQLVLARHPPWDRGPGSFGVVCWDVRADTIKHFHHERIIDVKTSLIEGL